MRYGHPLAYAISQANPKVVKSLAIFVKEYLDTEKERKGNWDAVNVADAIEAWASQHEDEQ